jgi:protein TonB
MMFKLSHATVPDEASAAAAHSVLASDSRRFAMAFLPAAAVTTGLFLMMTELVKVEEVTLAAPIERILETIVYEEEIPSPVQNERPVFEPISSETPPPPPEIRISGQEVGFPVITDLGQVPARTPVGELSMVMTTAQPVGDRIATPVRPPIPVYPSAMASRNIEGDCLVRFSLTARGLPFDVTAECSHRGFESEARRAVGKAEFLPRIVDGQAMESHGLSYPLEFRLSEEG